MKMRTEASIIQELKDKYEGRIPLPLFNSELNKELAPLFEKGLSNTEIARKLKMYNEKYKYNVPWVKYKRERYSNGAFRKKPKGYYCSSHYRKKVKANKGEIVHHIDLNRRNNKMENLVVCKNKIEHILLHTRQKRIFAQLMKNQMVCFDKSKKEYFIKR